LRGDGLLQGVPLQPLSQLQHLTRLRVVCEDPLATIALAKLPQLQYLQVRISRKPPAFLDVV